MAGRSLAWRRHPTTIGGPEMTFASPAGSQASVPLRSLAAVVLDTETTGLDPANDRIVQIGAVRLNAGGIDDRDSFDHLVNPGLPIPPLVTAVHGIGDADVADAAPFAEVMASLAAWTGRSVVIGYSLGFDLAVLKAEHERAGLAWRAPRSLDVDHLVKLLAPNLPGAGLDVAAAWLGIEVKNRHRALGDARFTAEMFLALVQKLQAKGILTLAQAERCCITLTADTEREARIGWHDVVTPGRILPASVADYARIDSFPYRHRIRDIMRAPPLFADGSTALQAALAVMMREKVSSLFLPADGAGAYGILTERDVLRAVDQDRERALGEPIGRYAVRPLVTLDQDEFVYRAISRMAARGFRHLGVHGADGSLVGALSARDLLKQRAGDALSLGDAIEDAKTPAALGRIWADLTTVARGLVHEDVDARTIAAVISRELRALTRRAAELAEDELLEAGMGGPPVPFALLVLGSGGRGESLLAMDQDNAIVYDEAGSGAGTDAWFEALGQRIATILNDVGVAYCKGGVMASNAAWRKDLQRWRQTVGEWIGHGRPEHILNADIFFDSLPVHGDRELGDRVRLEAIEAASRSRTFLQALSMQAAEAESPVGWFGRFRLNGGRVDLKKSGLMPIFATARVLALRHRISERSTPGRLEAAADRLEHGAKIIADLIEAHRTILDAILRQQLRDLDRGIPLSNAVVPAELGGLERQNLRWALDRIPSLATLLGVPAVQ